MYRNTLTYFNTDAATLANSTGGNTGIYPVVVHRETSIVNLTLKDATGAAFTGFSDAVAFSANVSRSVTTGGTTTITNLVVTADADINKVGDWVLADKATGQFSIRINANTTPMTTAMSSVVNGTLSGCTLELQAFDGASELVGVVRFAVTVIPLMYTSGVIPAPDPVLDYYTSTQIDALILGLTLRSPNGTPYQISVDNAGGLHQTTPVPVWILILSLFFSMTSFGAVYNSLKTDAATNTCTDTVNFTAATANTSTAAGSLVNLGQLTDTGTAAAQALSTHSTATDAHATLLLQYQRTSGMTTYQTTSGMVAYQSTSGMVSYQTTAGMTTYQTTAGMTAYSPTGHTQPFSSLTTTPTDLPGYGIVALTGSNEAAISAPGVFTNTDSAIGNLTFSATYTSSEVDALRDATETLADDNRALRETVSSYEVLLTAMRQVLIDHGLMTGAAP